MHARTRDIIYVIFMAIHLPATLLVDSQALFFAERISPPKLRLIFDLAAQDDFLLQNANHPSFSWFQSFIILEIIFQLPVFILGIRGLLKKNNTSIHPLLALYGISSATTTWACLATVVNTPALASMTRNKQLLTYFPFFLVPFLMAVDYGMRLTKVCRAVDEALEKKKSG